MKIIREKEREAFADTSFGPYEGWQIVISGFKDEEMNYENGLVMSLLSYNGQRRLTVGHISYVPTLFL